MMTSIVVVWWSVLSAYLMTDSIASASVFYKFPTSVSLAEGESLILPISNTFSSGDVRYCMWQIKGPGPGRSAWINTFGYDNEHSHALNTSSRFVDFLFLDKVSPCQSGIWSRYSVSVDSLVGSYRQVLVAFNGSTYNGPAMNVSAAGNQPEQCEEANCTGLVVVIVFLTLLLLTLGVLAILFWKKKLPESCMQHMRDPEKVIEKSKSSKEKALYEAERKKLIDTEEAKNNALDHIKQLEEQLEDKGILINNLESEKNEKQLQINKLHRENAELKRTVEAKEEELKELSGENVRLNDEAARQTQVIEELKVKLEEAKRPTTIEKMSNLQRRVRSRVGASFRSKDKPKRAGSRLSVDISSVFLVDLTDMNLKKDEDLKLEVKLAENFTPRWFRYGQQLEDRNSVMIGNAKKDPRMVKLKVKKKTPDMSGVYLCVASKDDMDSKTSQAVVRIVDGENMSPVFDEWPEDVYVNAGETVQFVVSVSAYPLPTPVWLHKGKSVDNMSNIKVEIHDKSRDRLTSVMTVENCSAKDTGDVKVSAVNVLGSTSCTAELAVLDDKTPPKFERGLRHRTARTGENVIFHVVVIANPDPNFEWTNGGKMIIESDRVKISHRYDGGRWISTLTIDACTKEDAGLLSVTVKNEVGDNFCDAQFTVVD